MTNRGVLQYGCGSARPCREKAEGVGFEPTWGAHPMGDFKSPAITALPPLLGVERPRHRAGPLPLFVLRRGLCDDLDFAATFVHEIKAVSRRRQPFSPTLDCPIRVGRG